MAKKNKKLKKASKKPKKPDKKPLTSHERLMKLHPGSEQVETDKDRSERNIEPSWIYHKRVKKEDE